MIHHGTVLSSAALIPMTLTLLFVLSSTILVQGYGKSNDPNDEPFLPIYPVYPYSPKLIKRGADKETSTQLSPELYAPKVDAKESYSASYASNYPRDPYYPSYNPYPKVSSPSGYAYYSSIPYSYPTAPYNAYNSYSTPYTVPPPSYTAVPYSSSYPNYYYQHAYHYPNYYNQPLFPPPPLPPAMADYPGDSASESEASDKSKEKEPAGGKKYRENELHQYVEGANYISRNPTDLDGQSSSYKSSALQKQLEQMNELQLKNVPIPLPKTTYRVISVAGQPVGPDYPLPPPYEKAQHVEEMMNNAWAKIFVQNVQQSLEANRNPGATHQNERSKDGQRFVSVPNMIAKAGLAYIVNPNLLGKLNVGQANSPLIQAPTTQSKSIKYPPLNPGVYTAIEKPGKDQTDSNDYGNYENSPSQSSQDYDGSLNPADKQQQQQQNYENDLGQNFVTVQPSRGYNYQYKNYSPPQTFMQYKSTMDETNFGTKTREG
ncbi:PREDICTED: uncharacterized protein LOC108580245 [Habropoda laboriosa]|uniref:uncharacterized protein LOC108580245 n=1 Tax=Habropoda laboriosa TaxID=597456 RepID=UPI00083D2B4D|nr:PREDICTED: uncharacterized protein LOC108580245 [Habropoda laboriosa]